MSQHIAQAQRTIKFTSKAGTYSAMIKPTGGDVWQVYEGEHSNPTYVAPRFVDDLDPYATGVTPVLKMEVTSSRVNEPLNYSTHVFLTGVQVNGTTLTWEEINGVQYSSNLFPAANGGFEKNHFKKVPGSGTNNPHGIAIVKDLVVASQGIPMVITMQSTVVHDLQTESIQASYHIPISMASSSDRFKVSIHPGDTNNFTISSRTLNTDGYSCILKAVTMELVETAHGKDYVEVNKNGLYYKWSVLDYADAQATVPSWVLLSNESGSGANDKDTLTVNEPDVNNYGMYKVEVFVGSSTGDPLGVDTQTITDVTDPIVIEPRPNPADETIVEGSTSGSAGYSVTYTPRTVTRGSDTAIANIVYDFILTDSYGVKILEPGEQADNVSSFTVTLLHCQRCHSDVCVIIYAVQAQSS